MPGPGCVEPATPRPALREWNIPPSRHRESLRSLARQWQVGCPSKSLQAPLRAYAAVHAGVVSSRHGWDSDTVSGTSPAAGDKMDHDVLAGDDFCLHTYGECLDGRI
jgi:hypothetical protein